MVVTVLVAAAGVSAVTFAARSLREVSALVPEVGPLRRALLAEDAAAVDVELRRLFPEDSDIDALRAALLRGSDSRAAVSALNEHLGTVDRALRTAPGTSRMLGRATFFAGMFGAVVEVARGGGAAGALAPATAALVVGALATVAVLELGRRAGAAAGRARAGWDDVGRLFSRRIVDSG